MLGDAYPARSFDRWAQAYDDDAHNGDVFPFVGYVEVVSEVVRQVAAAPGMSVLNLGIGTRNLARRFADLSCHVWGTDFSEAMLVKAQQNVPQRLRDAGPHEEYRQVSACAGVYRVEQD